MEEPVLLGFRGRHPCGADQPSGRGKTIHTGPSPPSSSMNLVSDGTDFDCVLVCVFLWQEVAKRTTTYSTVIEEQGEEEEDDNGVEAIEEDFQQQVRQMGRGTNVLAIQYSAE